MDRQIKKEQLWAHYKHPTKRYEIIELAKNSENLEEMVIYKALYQGDFKFGQVWVRTLKEFLEIIERNGKKIERFSLIEE
jgi:hypothetical protein